MLDADRLRADLEADGLGDWAASLVAAAAPRLDDRAHGDLPAWRAALRRLPAVARVAGDYGADAIGAPALALDGPAREAARDALRQLVPWRKGPFALGGLVVDSEWRSNLKWDRVAAAAGPWTGRRVLDVGSGNGYYALRMRGAGARLVIGLEPTLLYLAQFAAIAHFLEPEPVHLLPLRLDEVPGRLPGFDTVCSMGVLYHQRSPLDHLRQLRDALAPGGLLVLETLVLPGDEPAARTPPARYARMKNVWLLPTLPELTVWLDRTGYADIRLADETVTTPAEQRRTEWMPYESLAEALHPADPGRTVEGWPAPRRALVLAARPA